MIKAVIVEDDKNNVEVLSALLQKFCPEISLVGSANTAQGGVNLIRNVHPELVFLDVELGNETGFDVIKQFSSPFFKVIFTTAHEQYAFKAIKASCIEYLLKPVNYKELQEAVKKFGQQKSLSISQKKIEVLLDNLGNNPNSFGKLAIPTSEGYSFLNANEIMYCQADLNYTIIHTSKNERLVSSKNLKEFEELLNPSVFFRCHKSYIINLNFIKKFSRSDSMVQMANETQIDIAVRKKEDFLKLFEKF